MAIVLFLFLYNSQTSFLIILPLSTSENKTTYFRHLNMIVETETIGLSLQNFLFCALYKSTVYQR